MNQTWRIGQGFDRHRLAEGRPLVIGGVTIPHHRGAEGHSDADVLLHAVTDALLGAAGRGDIGEWFPDNDPAFAGADSSLLLARVLDELHASGWRVVNCDCTVFLEQPKLKDHKQTIRRRLADLLQIPIDAVNVKAKTGEQVGPVGEARAIEAAAIVLLSRGQRE